MRETAPADRVYVHASCATPEVLIHALIDRAPELEDVEIIHMKTLGCADYSHPQYEGAFRTVAMFIGDNVRDAIRDGRADYLPISARKSRVSLNPANARWTSACSSSRRPTSMAI
ncbi:MAG: hypothetical protein QM757_25760 [Paludibaculum sp.]